RAIARSEPRGFRWDVTTRSPNSALPGVRPVDPQPQARYVVRRRKCVAEVTHTGGCGSSNGFDVSRNRANANPKKTRAKRTSTTTRSTPSAASRETMPARMRGDARGADVV